MTDPVADLAARGFASPLGQVISQLLLSTHPRSVGLSGGRITVLCDDREIELDCADLSRVATPADAAALLKRAFSCQKPPPPSPSPKP